MSSIPAALGRGQHRTPPNRVAARRANSEGYREAPGDLPGSGFVAEAPWGVADRWLTCLTVDPAAFGATREDVRLALEDENIEARPVWKPMHLQPVFAGCRALGGRVSGEIFEKGLCLPSGSSLTGDDRSRVIDVVRRVGAEARE